MANFNEATQEYESVIDPGLGPSRVQKFSAKTLEELMSKMEFAQLNASQRIHTLSSYVQPDKAVAIVDFKPREMSADEMMQVGVDMQNPSTAKQAVEKIITAAIGASPEQIRNGLNNANQQRLISHYREQGNQFISDTPEYKTSPKNFEAMMKWLDAKEYPPTIKNLTLAFNELKQTEGGLPDGVNTLNPDGTQQQADDSQRRIASETTETRIATPPEEPIRRPRGSQSSGLRNDTHNAPGPTAPRPKWTKQQIRDMGEAEYERLYKSDAAFRAFVDKM